MIDPVQQKIREAQDHLKHKVYQACVDILSEVLELIPWDPTLRDLRAEAYLGMGNIIHALSDIRTTTKLRTDDTSGFFKLSQLHYELGEAEESLSEVRECLRLDPEHKECYPFYKKVKKVAKFVVEARTARNEERFEDCVDAARKMLKNEPEVDSVRFHGHGHLCHCQLKLEEPTEARKSCSEALKVEEEPRLLCDRADAYLAEDMFDEVYMLFHIVQFVRTSFLYIIF